MLLELPRRIGERELQIGRGRNGQFTRRGRVSARTEKAKETEYCRRASRLHFCKTMLAYPRLSMALDQ